MAGDRAHERVKAFTRDAKPDLIVTTEEVLTEYLNYFACWGAYFRNKIVVNTHDIIGNRAVRIVGQTAESFRIGLDLYAHGLTRVIA